MSRIIHAYGLLASPLQVSAVLTQLKVGHTVFKDSLTAPGTELHFDHRQPAWPVILPTIQAMSRYRCKANKQILMICDSLALLSTCNLRTLKPHNMEVTLKKALEYAVANPMDGWALVRREPSIKEYVDNATTPSYLNLIQSDLYKITPYDLRREVQALLIGCLAGVETKAKLVAKLKSSHKLDSLLELIKDPKFIGLRDAVALFKSNGDADATALSTGYQSFEILYVTRSANKTLKTASDKKAGKK